MLKKHCVLVALMAACALLGLAEPAMSQTRKYKTITKIPPFKGTWGAGSPVAPLTGARWSDGSQGGGYVLPDPKYKVKRTSDGQPRIEGVWATAGLLRASEVVDPPDGKVPYHPWASEKLKDLYENYISPNATCVPKGVLSLMRYISTQIIQSPGEVLIISEHLTNFRHIRLDGSPHIGKGMKLWMGDSRGRWEGDTLVVDARNFNDKTVPFHSEQLRVTERFTPVAEGTLQYESTIEDPVVFERPYTVAYPVVETPNYEMYEENCHDGNRTVVLQLKNGLKLYTGPSSLE